MNTISLQQRVLKCDEDIMGAEQIDEARKKLNIMTFQISRNLKGDDSIDVKVTRIIDYLFKEEEYKSGYENKQNVYHRTVSSAILNKNGGAFELAILFLMLAESLELPMYGIVYPYYDLLPGYDSNDKSYVIDVREDQKILDDKHLDKLVKKYTRLNKEKYLKIHSLDEVFGVYLSWIGNLYFYSSCYKKALTYFKRHAKIAPEFPRVNYHLGCWMAKAKRHERAITMLEKEIKVDPDFVFSYLQLAYIYSVDEKRYTKTNEYLQKVIELANTN